MVGSSRQFHFGQSGPVEPETEASYACTEASKLRLPNHEVVLETYAVDSWGDLMTFVYHRASVLVASVHVISLDTWLLVSFSLLCLSHR